MQIVISQTRWAFRQVIAVILTVTVVSVPLYAQSGRWNAPRRGVQGSMQRNSHAGGHVNTNQPYLNVAGIGRVPFSPRLQVSPGHSAFQRPYYTSGYYSAGGYSAGGYSAGSYSADRYGRYVTGASRGRWGGRNHWHGIGRGSSVIVAPTWGWSPYGTSYGSSYVTPYASYYSSSLSINTVPYITPYNAHTIPVITPPCWYSGYGCASMFGPVFYGNPIGAFGGYIPGYSLINVSIGSYGSPGYAAAPAIAPSLPVADPFDVIDQQAEIPDFDGQIAVVNEFQTIVTEPRKSSLPDKIHSLRYQASGDDAFRKHDFPSAEVFYRTAVEMAPERPATYLRLAFVHVAEGDYAQAASWLKTGLDLPSDRTQAWVRWHQLYGNQAAELMREHGDGLWDWVAERPLSTDRLLVAGAFQKLRGYDGTADELLEIVHSHGNETRVNSLLAMIDSAARAKNTSVISIQSSVDAIRQAGDESANQVSTAAPSSPAGRAGIVMRGSDRLAPATPVPPKPDVPGGYK
jgi:Tetratricopeptide repeat